MRVWLLLLKTEKSGGLMQIDVWLTMPFVFHANCEELFLAKSVVGKIKQGFLLRSSPA
jgi:hypothetical protein